MKKVLLFLMLLITSLSYGQTADRTISLSVKDIVPDKSLSPELKRDLQLIVDSAFKIASAILNSPEFQKEIDNMQFDCESDCDGCNAVPDKRRRISGKEVLNRLFAEKEVALTLEVRESGGALGETSKGSYYTTAWHENIMDDMPEFKGAFAYGLAVNICHEYMHQLGFCHLYCTGWKCPSKYSLREGNSTPDPKFIKEDVTYKVGWAAFYILEKWYNEKKKLI